MGSTGADADAAVHPRPWCRRWVWRRVAAPRACDRTEARNEKSAVDGYCCSVCCWRRRDETVEAVCGGAGSLRCLEI